MSVHFLGTRYCFINLFTYDMSWACFSSNVQTDVTGIYCVYYFLCFGFV